MFTRLFRVTRQLHARATFPRLSSARFSSSSSSSSSSSTTTTTVKSSTTPTHDGRCQSPDGLLTPSQLAFWSQNGFLVLEDFVPAASCASLHTRMSELVREFAESPAGRGQASVFSTRDNNQAQARDDYFLTSGDKVRFFFEERALDADTGALVVDDVALALNKVGHALQELEPVFARVSNADKVANVATSLGFQDPRIVQGMYIFKQARIGGEVVPHQDSTFLYTEPLSTVGLWLAVEDATLQNGCLWAVPGSHRTPVQRRFVRTWDEEGKVALAFEPEEEDLPLEPAVPLEVRRGTVVLLHGSLVHYSEDNKTDKSRHAYTVHVIDGACEYPDTNWLQRSDGKEFIKLTGTEKMDE